MVRRRLAAINRWHHALGMQLRLHRFVSAGHLRLDWALDRGSRPMYARHAIARATGIRQPVVTSQIQSIGRESAKRNLEMLSSCVRGLIRREFLAGAAIGAPACLILLMMARPAVCQDDVLKETWLNGIAARELQCDKVTFKAKRTYGPNNALLDWQRAYDEFHRMAAKAASAPSKKSTDDSPTTLGITKSIEYWTAAKNGPRFALYFALEGPQETNGSWTCRDYFNGKHWERYLLSTSVGPQVTISTRSDSPPVLATIGLDVPSAIIPGSVRMSRWLTSTEEEWVIDSCELAGDKNDDDARIVEVKAHQEKTARTSGPMVMHARWDISKGMAPLSIEIKTAMKQGDHLTVVPASRGIRATWSGHHSVAEGLWIPDRLIVEQLMPAFLPGPSGEIYFVETAAGRTLDGDGLPMVDFNRHSAREFVTSSEDWELSDFSLESQAAMDFGDQYPAGTIVQNELGNAIEVYQLLDLSPAVTTTMRKMLEGHQSRPIARGGDPVKLIIFINLVAVLIVCAVIFWRKRRNSSGATPK